MTKKLFLITFIFLSVKLFAETPILSNFRVEDSQNNLVYFDSSIPITASNVAGFTIRGKSVSGVTINAGQKIGHYFTVATQFTFWDNNTIQYEGGSDLQDLNSDPLLEFTLTYIENNISEPIASTNRYVSTSATGNGNGTNDTDQAWTIAQATSNSNLSDRMTIWIKAGDYGNVNFEVSGFNPLSVVKYIGYTNTIGDISAKIVDDFTSYSQKASIVDPSVYPVFTGQNTFSSHGVSITWASSKIIIKNIQTTNYSNGFNIGRESMTKHSSNIHIENCTARDSWTETSAGKYELNYGNGFIIEFMKEVQYSARNIRFLNNLSVDAASNGFLMDARHGLIKGSKSYSGIVGSDAANDFRAQDYYFVLAWSSDSCILKDNEAWRINDDNHGGHGMGIRGEINDIDGSTTFNIYNLIDGNYTNYIGENYMVTWENGHHNVFKNNVADNLPPGSTTSISCRDGAHDNIFENNKGIGGQQGITRWASLEMYTQKFETTNFSKNNIFRNNIFIGCEWGLVYVHNDYVGTLGVSGDKVYNNTFITRYSAFLVSDPNPILYDEEIKNNIFYSTSSSNTLYNGKPIESEQSYNNYYKLGGSYSLPSGTGNVQIDPNFIDLVGFEPQTTLNGTPLSGVEFDFNGDERDETTPTIGAKEKKNGNPISANAGPDITICNNPDGSASTTTLTATGLGSSFLWSTGETTTSIDVSPSTTTTYTVTVSDGVNPDDSDDVIVTVNESPTVDLGSDQSICYGETVTLTATGTGDFLWNTGDTTASITVNPTTTTTYSITASNSCATDATDDIIVNVNPEIGLTVGSDISICVGENTTLTATGNGDFLWNTGETTPSITVQPNSTTTYTVTSNLGTCTENANILVTVSEVPSVDLGSDQSICYGETVTLTATGTGDFLWNTGETTASITINPTTTTTYSATASNSCATDATDEIIINVNPEIGLTVGNDISICIGENTTLTAAGNGDFLWSTGETTPIITVQPNSTTTYSVSSSLGACTENASILVTVNTPPSVDLGSDQSICYGESVTLSATGTGNFLWNTGETTASITVNPTTTTTYNVTASNACSDDVTDDIIVNVNPEIGLTVGNDISICTGESTILTAAGNGDFLWNTGETTASITVQPNSNTTYTVTSSLGTCSESASVIVTISDSATVDLGPDKSICYGETVTLTATGSGNFLWNTGETTASITVNPTTSATYSVTASNSCSGDATDDITVNVNALPSVNAGEDITILNGESTTLTATGNGNFLWSTGEASPSITVNPTSTTSYSVVITSDQGCLNQDTVVVTVENTESIIADAGPDQNVCPDSSDTVLTASGGESYLWSTGETTASITVNPTVTTVYTVAVYVGNTHTLDEVTVYIDESCSDNISSVQQEFKLYPNPTHGILHIEMTGVNGDLSISLFNLSGTLVYSENLNNSSKAKVLKQKINLNKFAKGIYFVRLDSNGNRETKKIILI